MAREAAHVKRSGSRGLWLACRHQPARACLLHQQALHILAIDGRAILGGGVHAGKPGNWPSTANDPRYVLAVSLDESK